jgi:hypothetical protein
MIPAGSDYELKERAALHSGEAILRGRMSEDAHLEAALDFLDDGDVNGKVRTRKNAQKAKGSMMGKPASNPSGPLPSVSSLLAARAAAAAPADAAASTAAADQADAAAILKRSRCSKNELHILTKCRAAERREKQTAQAL